MSVRYDESDYLLDATPCRCGCHAIAMGFRPSLHKNAEQFYAFCDACCAIGDAERTESAAVASWNAAVSDPERMLAVDMSAGAPMIHYAPAATPAQRKRIAVHAQLYRRYVAGRDGGSA